MKFFKITYLYGTCFKINTLNNEYYFDFISFLFGYPKEHEITSDGPYKKVTRLDGTVWTLTPTMVYTRRRASPFKNNKRYGWKVVGGPDKFIGQSNLEPNVHIAVNNMITGNALIAAYLSKQIDV